MVPAEWVTPVGDAQAGRTRRTRDPHEPWCLQGRSIATMRKISHDLAGEQAKDAEATGWLAHRLGGLRMPDPIAGTLGNLAEAEACACTSSPGMLTVRQRRPTVG